LLGTAVKLHSTKNVCGNREETNLHHDNLVAAARYCQPMGYYNRWDSQYSNYAVGCATSGSNPGTVKRYFSSPDHLDQL
jgi:hypothetical protein